MLKKLRYLAPLLLVAFAFSAVHADGDGYKEAKAKYDKSAKRPSLHKRAQGMAAFAETKEVSAIKELAKRYKKPENENPSGGPESKKGEPQEAHIQYLIADLLGRAFAKPEDVTEDHLKELFSLIKSQKKDPDAWLWYNVWCIAIKAGQEAKAIEEFEKNSDPFLKAAILEAFARAQNGTILPALKEYLTSKKLPRKEHEREVILRSSAAALLGAYKQITEDGFKETGYALVELMVADETLLETKLAISRTLGALYGVKKRYVSGSFWRSRIGAGIVTTDGSADKEDEGSGTRVRFMGVEAAGKRVVFCIDFSDSMLTPLTDGEKDAIKKPISGGDSKKEEKKDDELPWDKIHNRFDLAREYLKLAIDGLAEDVVFMVVWFGDGKAAFTATQGLVEADESNKRKAISELMAFKPNTSAKSPTRPHGTLKGKTNIHGALRTAFKAYGPRYDEKNKKFKGKSGFIGDYEHVEENVYVNGADTVFVLSDGKPSFDDWPALDDRDPEDGAGDPESGAKAPDQPVLLYWGPYVWSNYLVRDVQRMNQYRDAEINCIAIGEADPKLLEAISREGHGSTTQMGAAGKK